MAKEHHQNISQTNDDNAKHDNLTEIKKKMNLPLTNEHSTKIRKTNDWANSILKDLDNLVLSNKRYAERISNSVVTNTNVNTISPTSPSSQKRSTIINVVLRKTTPASSPTSSTAPTTIVLNDTIKNPTAIINEAKCDNNNILKPEKHVSRFIGFLFMI